MDSRKEMLIVTVTPQASFLIGPGGRRGSFCLVVNPIHNQIGRSLSSSNSALQAMRDIVRVVLSENQSSSHFRWIIRPCSILLQRDHFFGSLRNSDNTVVAS